MDTKIAAENLMEIISDHEPDKIASRSTDGRGTPHALWMLEGIAQGYVQGEKAHRWVGYVQGMMVTLALATLEEMKAVNHAA